MRFSGSVRLRPVRAALLVSPDDMPTIRRFMRLCTCVWGGQYNPIVPVFEQLPESWSEWAVAPSGFDVARGYIEFFEPDLLIEASPGMADKLGWKQGRSSFQMSRLASLDHFFKADDRGRIDFAAGVDMIHAFFDLYDKEYKFERRHKVPSAYFDPDADAGAFFEAVGGAYPKDEALKYILDAYCDVFEPELLPATAESLLRMLKDEYRTPLWATGYGLEESLGNRSWEPTVFIFDPLAGQDVIDFWNYCLIRRDVLPINVHWFSECKEFLCDLIKRNYRPLPGNPSGIMIQTRLVFARSINEEQVKSLANAHLEGLPEGSFYWSRHGVLLWSARDISARGRGGKTVVTADSASYDEEISENGYVKIPALAPSFHNKAETYTSSIWMNVIQPTGRWANDRVATVFPSNLWQPEFPALFGGDPLTVTREGWVTPVHHELGYALIQPMTGRDALVGWLETQGITAVPSDAGQVADQLISAAGNLNACGMFCDRETVDLLNSMAERHSEPRRGRRKVRRTMPDRTRSYNVIKNHFRRREERSWGYWAKLDYFLERSVFRAGLRVQCPNCAFYNWYDLKSIDYVLICNRCLKEFSFNQSPDHLKSTDWYYRVVGPFATPDYAQGGYSVALTLSRLAERHHDIEVTWSTGLELQPLNVEVDFIAWYRRWNVGINPEAAEPVLMIGEAKSYGKDAFKPKDMEVLKAVGEKFPGAFLVVSALKTIDEYSSAERTLLTELATWGRAPAGQHRPRNPVIILTGAELMTERDLRHTWQEMGGKAAKLVERPSIFLDDPYTLSELTQILYLGLPGFYEDRWQPKPASDAQQVGKPSKRKRALPSP